MHTIPLDLTVDEFNGLDVVISIGFVHIINAKHQKVSKDKVMRPTSYIRVLLDSAKKLNEKASMQVLKHQSCKHLRHSKK